MSIEKQLRDTLHRLAEDLGPTEPAAGLRAEGMRVLAHRRKRQRIAALSAGLAAVLVAVAVPVGLSLLTRAKNTADDVAAPPSQGSDASIFDRPTRGSFAGDTAFVEAVRQLPWQAPDAYETEFPNPPVETHHVVFAGEFVKGDPNFGTAALVVGEISEQLTGTAEPTPDSIPPPPPMEPTTLPLPPDLPEPPSADTADPPSADTADPPSADTADPPSAETSPQPTSTPQGTATGSADPPPAGWIAAVWFTGPSGASADQLSPGLPRWISADLPTSIVEESTGTLLMVAAPDDAIEVSARPEVAANATVTRDYLDAGAELGVAVTQVEAPAYAGAPSVRYRVTRQGAVVAERQPDERIHNADLQIPDLELNYLRPPAYAGQDVLANQESQIAGGILSEYGLSPEELALEVHYVGPMPGRPDAYTGLYLLTAIFPSGAVLTRAEWIELAQVSGPPSDDGGFASGVCADQLSPAGLPAAQRTVAIRCDVGVGGNDSQRPYPEATLIVVAPPDTAAVDAVVEATNGSIGLPIRTGGIAMSAFPEGAQTVLIQGRDGMVLEEVPIWTM